MTQTVPQHSASQSIRRIKRLIWLPVCALSLVFIIILSAFIWKDLQSTSVQLRQDLIERLEATSPVFLENIVNDQPTNLQSSLEQTAGQLAYSYPHAQICVRIVSFSSNIIAQVGCGKFITSELSEVVTLVSGDQSVAHVLIGTRVDYLAYEGIFMTLFAFAVAMVISLFVVHKLGLLIDDQIVSPLVSQIEQRSKEIGAAVTTQMFAHDVRRPLNMVKGIIARVRDAESTGEARSVIDRYAHEVDVSIERVNAMVQDILSLGKESDKIKSPTPLAECIEIALTGLQHGASKTVHCSYEITHGHQPLAVKADIIRVFVNLLTNAIHATPHSGKIWIRSTEGDGRITVAVGNNGSYVAPEEREHLFDIFYTKDKRQGTGLGLAISKKIVNDHGGTIACLSDPELGTEFQFTLPISEAMETQVPRKLPTKIVPDSGIKPNEMIPNPVNGFRQHINVVIADDDPFYRGLLASTIQRCTSGAALPQLWMIDSPEGVGEICASKSIDLVVVDYDFGHTDMTGIDVAKALRSAGYVGLICLHSNFIDEELRRDAEIVGIDFCIEKPMPQDVVDELLINLSDAPASPELVVVDDSVFQQSAWRQALKNTRIQSFHDPESVLTALAEGKLSLESTKAIVLDYYFDGASKTGIDLGSAIRRQGYKGQLFMATEAGLSSQALAEWNITSIPKEIPEALAQPEINQLFAEPCA